MRPSNGCAHSYHPAFCGHRLYPFSSCHQPSPLSTVVFIFIIVAGDPFHKNDNSGKKYRGDNRICKYCVVQPVSSAGEEATWCRSCAAPAVTASVNVLEDATGTCMNLYSRDVVFIHIIPSVVVVVSIMAACISSLFSSRGTGMVVARGTISVSSFATAVTFPPLPRGGLFLPSAWPPIKASSCQCWGGIL